MKIGIVTLVQYNDNYGGALQAFALQTALQELGHTSFFANYAIKPAPLELKRALTKPIRKFQQTRRYNLFIPFWKKYFIEDPCGRRKRKDFLAAPTEADAYICGSDQVWARATSPDPCKFSLAFLDFGAPSLKRIAYAPSFGSAQLEQEQIEALKVPLSRFKAISVREEGSLNLIRACGREAEWVIDPTMLFDSTFWNKIAVPSKPTRPKCFLATYRWKTMCSVKTAAQQVCEKLRCKLEVPCSETPFQFPSANITVGPEEWISHIRDAKFVLTNSFHCMVFAILFHKPFAVLALSGKNEKMNVRIESLTKRLGLENRIIKTESEIARVLETSIDWDAVDTRVVAWRNASWQFLKNALL